MTKAEELSAGMSPDTLKLAGKVLASQEVARWLLIKLTNPDEVTRPAPRLRLLADRISQVSFSMNGFSSEKVLAASAKGGVQHVSAPLTSLEVNDLYLAFDAALDERCQSSKEGTPHVPVAMASTLFEEQIAAAHAEEAFYGTSPAKAA